MSENEKNIDPEKTSSEDDELESLNDEEKAAFEKIMAEIASATGDTSGENQKQSSSPPVEADGPSATLNPENEAVPSETDTPDKNAETTQEQVSEKSEVEQPNAENKSNADQDDELDEDQQTALDQIMAEIESKHKGKNKSDESEPSAPAPAEDESEEALNEDQAAALSQIMAEIESKRKGEKDSDSESPPQEAETEAEAEAEAEEEDLDENQQAALSQIMAEIESKRKGEKEVTSESMDENKEDAPDTDSDDAEQQAALEKIMAEIEAQKNDDSDESLAASGGTESEIVAEQDDASETDNDSLSKEISMDDFDTELNNLLSSASQPTSSGSSNEEIAGTEANKTAKDDNASIADDTEKELEHPVAADSVSLKDEPNEPLNDDSDHIPLLQEISSEIPSKKVKQKSRRGSKKKLPSTFVKKTLKASVIALVYTPVLIIAGGICYWAYHHFINTSQDTAPPSFQGAGVAMDAGPSQGTGVAMDAGPSQTPGTTIPDVAETPSPVVQTVTSRTPAAIFSTLRKELSTARLQIKNKISDIRQLKSYYDRGVTEEYDKIEERLLDGRIPSFQKAMADEKIELALRAIQRRKVYMTKLETPLTQLTAISEELLYLERKTHIYEILQMGINGLPVESFKDEVLKAIKSYLQYQSELSIDQLEVDSSSLADIWDQVAAHLDTKANLLAQREPLNRSISAEICQGNYDRKYLLTAISEKSAGCLLKWGGKDLYLNAVTELPPEIAKILAQWKGEWLSLNGLTELSAESANYLAQWRGKRLSLNGLTHLPQEVTQYLSQWGGEQLEMVGLRSIGSWENYGTKLFLSEKLKQTIEEQVQQ